MLLKPLQSLLQFTTTLPLGKTGEFRHFATHSYLYPVAGYVTGGLAGLVAYWIGDPGIRAAVAIGALLLITGANHFDGLLDFGDGLMAHGGRENRIRALTDRQIGTGGVATGSFVLLLTFTSLSSTTQFLSSLIIAEVLAKFSMAFLTAYGPPLREGLHATLHKEARPWFPPAAAIFCIPLLLLPVSPVQVAGAGIAALLAPTSLLLVSHRLFGGVNGDVVGASGEITRSVVLCTLVLIPAGTLF